MCEFCEDIAMNDDEYMKKRYAGGDFICKDEDGFGVLIDTGDSGCLGYIKINYCPICDFLKSEQETDEDSFKKISSERKNDDGQSCV